MYTNQLIAIRIALASKDIIVRRLDSASRSAGNCLLTATIKRHSGRVQMIRQPTNSNGGTLVTSKRYSGRNPQIR